MGNASGYSVDFAVVRYNQDGSLDTSFDSDGRVVTDFAGGDDTGWDVALQPDGKIVVVGVASNATKDFAVVRYNPDGSLDPTFDGDGRASTDFSGGDDWGMAVSLQTDGKIVLAGAGGITQDFAVARFNPNGSLDIGFDSDGKVVTDFGGYDAAIAVAMQPDDKIFVAGTAFIDVADSVLESQNPGERHMDGDETPTSMEDFALARYNPDGSLDTSFGGDGMVVTDLGGYDECQDIALQADGKPLVIGFTPADFVLIRYNPDGSLDTSFNDDGVVTIDFGGYDYGHALVVQDDRKILTAGFAYSITNDFALGRLNPDGSLDTSFGLDGKVVTDIAGGYDAGYALALQADGRIVVAGYANNGTDFDVTTVRYR